MLITALRVIAKDWRAEEEAQAWVEAGRNNAASEEAATALSKLGQEEGLRGAGLRLARATNETLGASANCQPPGGGEPA